ncbi:hypothetical protein VTK26DRAFT_9050 [Humicola hyalothermophila]
MEVFLRNLPPHLTGNALQKQLQPLMEGLHIVDYLAEKQRNRTYGHITFLKETDGQRFLQRHGEVPLPQTCSISAGPQRQPRTQAHLTLMGKHVFCKLSNREPHELTLRSIEYEAQQRQIAHDAPPDPVRTLEASELSCGYNTFVNGRLTFTAEWTARERCLVKFTKQSLVITLARRGIQLRISFQTIVEMLWWQDGSVCVTLSWAPTMIRTSNPKSMMNPDLAELLYYLTMAENSKPEQCPRLLAIDANHQTISEFCLTYHFKVPNPVTRHTDSDFHREISRLRQKQPFPVTRYDLGFQHAYLSRLGSFAAAAKAFRAQLADYNGTASLPFELLFLLEALLTNGYLHPTTLSALAQRLVDKFAAARASGGNQPPPVSVDAFKKLFDWIDYPSPGVQEDKFQVDGILSYLDEAEQLIREGYAVRSKFLDDTQNRARIFRAIVGPTRVTLHGPELEPMNRLLRKFPNHTSYFIRAQFCDESGQDLFFSPRISLDDVYDRFKLVLKNGIRVAGRLYKLLGFSHSSLRAHSAWLLAPFVHDGELHFSERIIRGLGDFGGIRSPARRAARIGQAFSETPYAVDLDADGISVHRIPDVERGARVFSDGVGTLSPAAADAIHAVLPRSKGLPTCFQIRWGGAKGMLALDPRLAGSQICIRPSMAKFDSADTRFLEICDVASRPLPMVLNRQLIKILEDMGAPADWFLRLSAKEVRRIRGITASVFNTATFLRTQAIGEAVHLHRFLRQTELMDLDYRQDAFLRGAIEAVLLRELRLLKHKARIPVRKGITLFGVMDETGYLKEGEIYVTYHDGSSSSSSRNGTVDGGGGGYRRFADPPGPGKVIVTRSPALHPGDVQTAWNNVPPEGHPLLNLRNCVVFSSCGERDLPSQLSGGDLDGDMFHVIWDPDVVDYVETFEPADYPRVKPLELDREVQLADMADFFVEFMKADDLGVVATRHMILADQREQGTLDKDCIKLAELHSSAVDFSKSGRPVEMSELPRANSWRPDFLASGPAIEIHDKSAIRLDQHTVREDGGDDDDDAGDEGPRHRYYYSDKILGRLFRSVDEQKIWSEDIKMVIDAGSASFWDEFLAHIHHRVRSSIGEVEWQHRTGEAHRIRLAYTDAIHGLTIDFAEHPHKPLTELEVFIGLIINRTGVHSRRQRDKSVRLKDEYEHVATWILQEMHNPTSVSGHTSELDALELCLACLYVGCLSEKEAREYGTTGAGKRNAVGESESFKVVAATALLKELSSLEKRING